MSTSQKASKTVLDALEIKRILSRIAHEIIEKNRGLQDVVLIGIHTGGVPLVHRIGRNIEEIESVAVPIGELDITLYRDDLSGQKETRPFSRSKLPGDITDKKVVLVDDVLFTGRTIRAAMDELIDFGRPREIQLAVLVDRGHRELPIRANYVGKSVPTSRNEIVKVLLKESAETDKVIIENGN